MSILENTEYVKEQLELGGVYLSNSFILQTILGNRDMRLNTIVNVLKNQFPMGCNILPNRQFVIHRGMGYLTTPQQYNYTPITIGLEWEGNIHETSVKELRDKVVGWFTDNEEVEQTSSLTGWGANWENELIYELQTPVFSLLDVEKCLKLFQTFLKHGAANQQSGEDDPLAGSMHTHIGFDGEIPRRTEEVIPLITKLKEKSYFNKTKDIPHRTTNGGARASALTENRNIPANSKLYEVTINKKQGKTNTLEVRYNESPTPIWVWFTPFFGGMEYRLNLDNVILYWVNQGMSYYNIKKLIEVLEKLEEYGNTTELHDYILSMDLGYEN